VESTSPNPQELFPGVESLPNGTWDHNLHVISYIQSKAKAWTIGMGRPILIIPCHIIFAAVYAGDDEVDNVCVNCVNYLYRNRNQNEKPYISKPGDWKHGEKELGEYSIIGIIPLLLSQSLDHLNQHFSIISDFLLLTAPVYFLSFYFIRFMTPF
jgi:hypothetical protein